MAYVHDILAAKGSRVFTVTPDSTVYEATAKMNQHRLGALVVTSKEDPSVMLGVFTERDVLRRVVAQLRYPDLVTVAEVMTTDVLTCTPETEIAEAAAIMQDRRVRHLPVMNHEGRVIGLISIGDINAYYVARQQAQINELSDYICGRA
ncbi:MAG: CBS domain-containing protein [Tepidisphaeraceae bacterium]